MGQLDIGRILREVWKQKWWFILTVSISVAIAYLFIRYSSQTYTVRSKILIKTKTDQSYTSSSDYLNVNSLLGKEIDMSNEINILQSTPLISNVLNELGLMVSYYLQEDKLPRQFAFSMIDIYDESPILVVLENNHAQPANILFYFKAISTEEFTLSCQGEEVWLFNPETREEVGMIPNLSLNGNYRFGETVSTDFTSFKILLKSNFNPEEFLNKDLYFRFNNMGNLALIYQDALSIDYSTYEGSVATLSFTGDNINKSLDFLDGLINTYLEKNLEEKTYLANTTIQYIDRQLANITDTLTKTEQELQNFRRSYNIINPDAKYNRIYNQLAQLEDNKDEVTRRFNLLQQMKAYFDTNRDSSSSLIIPSTMGLEDPILQSLITELIKNNTERQQLIQNNQLKSSRLLILNSSIDNLIGSIEENIDFGISNSTSELQEINNKITNLNSEFSRLPQTQRQLLGIERQFNLSQDVYNSLAEKRVQAQIARSSTLPDCEIIEPAFFVEVASPKLMMSLAIALFLGFLIPSSLIFGRILLNDKIEDAADVKQLSKLPQIGELPAYKHPSGNVMVNHPTDILAESFRTLRSNIDFYLMGEKHKIILVTSSIPQEGKSMTSLNLATAFSLTNNYTLHLPLDLRKSSESYSFTGESGLVGSCDYLIREANLEDIITQTELPNLDTIPIGKTPPNPVELLTSERMNDLVNQLRHRYDYIIIDTPPFGMVADAFILMKYSDINLYISRLGTVTAKLLKQNLEEIRGKKLENIYHLINGINPNSAGYGRYAYYPYGSSKRTIVQKIFRKKGKHDKKTA